MSFLNKEEIGLVTKSFERVQLQKGFLADTFYRKLLIMAPAARELFPQGMSEQLNKFTSMLDFLVVNLHQPWFFTGKLKNWPNDTWLVALYRNITRLMAAR